MTAEQDVQTGKADSLPILSLTAQIVAAHVAKNPITAGELPTMIGDVFQTLHGLTQPQVEEQEKPEPAVPIKKSVTDDYIICLEDGRQLKMLKRHLKTAYNMTPEEYRRRWNLPRDYPMVAPNYARKRQHLAKQIGLGRSRETASAAAE